MRGIKIFVLCALCLLLAGCGAGAGNGAELPPEDASGDTAVPPSGAVSAGGIPPVDLGGQAGDAAPAGDGDSAQNLPAEAPETAPYAFGTPLEESEAVEDSYFADAVFLGDSRTEGLQKWGGIMEGDYLWKRGMSVFSVDSQKFTFDLDGEKVTMLGALARKQYAKVYVMIGINELGYTAGEYERGLGALLDNLAALQPEAVIYLQTLPPVNDELAAKYLSDHDRNANVDAFNEVIVRMAAEKRVVLLNTAEVYRGEDGQLPADMSADGEHFTSAGYPLWADYLRCHTMDAERYFLCREAAEDAPAGEGAPA